MASEGKGRGGGGCGGLRFDPAESHGSIGILAKLICKSTGWTRADDLIGRECSC